MAKSKPSSEDSDILAEAKEKFQRAVDAEDDNRTAAIDDIKFGRLEEQWPTDIITARQRDGRPCLTIPILGPIIRQVVNDARQNKPAIRVTPVDSSGDIETADIYSDLIRNIEQQSHADHAYDTGIDNAVSGGFGYWRIGIDYPHDGTFDKEITIDRVMNPFSVYGDPDSTAADSSDWNCCFVVDRIPKDQFEAQFGDAGKVDWDTAGYSTLPEPWFDADGVLVAEYWMREEVEKPIYLFQSPDGGEQQVFNQDYLDGESQAPPLTNEQYLLVQGWKQVDKRNAKSWKVTQRRMTGAEILPFPATEVDGKKTTVRPWAGKWIPIIPCYGEEVVCEGVRTFKSLIRSAKDAQRNLNYWRHLSLDTPLPTPSGWTTMGNVSIGDELFDEQGKPCKVIGKSPVTIGLDCYRVKFDDGSEIVASESHVWQVEERIGELGIGRPLWITKKIATKELIARKHYIWATKPIQCPEIDLLIHPYLLGLWLGDGHSASARITPGDEDIDEIRDILVGLGYELGEVSRPKGSHGTFSIRGLHAQLSELGLLGNKHVPAQYLRASESQRWQLLQGLMDSDGSISRNTKICSFTTIRPSLANAYAELLRSLGIKAVSLLREGRHSKLVGADCILQPAYQFSFSSYADEPLFRLSRKVALQGGRREHRRRTKRHRITSVEQIPSVPVQCVGIDAPSHLFLAGEAMVPTHNSAATELVALAPRVPFIGPKGFAADDPNWSNANKASLAYLEVALVNGQYIPPTRQPLDTGAAAGALQEAMNAESDIKNITGIHEASLGAPSNETSGKAILARQKEGDTSTFHFIDNQHRAIAHTGRILVDLIPKVYGSRQILRVLGEDGKERMVKMGQPVPVMGPDGKPVMQPGKNPDGSPMMQMGQNGPEPVMVEMTRVNDLQTGRYDVNLSSGPSYTSRREAAADQLTQAMQAVPSAAPIILPEIFKNLDLPGAEDIAQKMEALAPHPNQGPSPEIQQQMKEASAKFDALTQERDQLQAALKTATDKSQQGQADTAVKAASIKVEVANAKIAAYRAVTERFQAVDSGHLKWQELGIDFHLELADLQLAQAELQQAMQGQQQAPQQAPQMGQGGPMGPGQPQPPPQAAPQPMPMQRPPMMQNQGMPAGPHRMPDGTMMNGGPQPPQQMPMNGPMPQGMPPRPQ